MRRPPSQQGLLPPAPLSVVPPPPLAPENGGDGEKAREQRGGGGQTDSSGSSPDPRRRQQRHPSRRQRLSAFFSRSVEVAATQLRRGATVLVSCVGGVGGGKGKGNSCETAAAAGGFLSRRRRQQQEQQQYLQLSLASTAAAAEAAAAMPPPQHQSSAPGNGNGLKVKAKAATIIPPLSSTAAAVAALSAARDAAALLLDSREALGNFERLRSRALRSAPPACDAALHPENRRKNRYSDVLAPDHSRVVLRSSLEEVIRGGGGGAATMTAPAAAANEQDLPSSPPSPSPSPSPSSIGGYINASLLSSRPGETPAWSYVAAQGPLASTVPDFWKLVAQLRSPVVVSLTRPEERGAEKCARYLPAAAYRDGGKSSSVEEEGGGGEGGSLPHSAVFGGFRVSCGRARAAGPGLVARPLAVEVVSSSSSSATSTSSSSSSVSLFRHSLLHLHVDDWPDHGAPASSASLRAAAAAMRRAVDEAAAAAAKGKERREGVVGPPVVHCSAGIGRTGTLLAVDIAARRLRAAIEEASASSPSPSSPSSAAAAAAAAHTAAARAVAVRRVVRRLRDRRPGMVQTPGQYAAVVAAVRDEAAELLITLTAEGTEETSAASAPVPVVAVPPGGLLSDEGSGEDD